MRESKTDDVKSVPSISINRIIFTNGTTLDFPRSGVVLIVGANNVGKSMALKEIHSKLAGGGSSLIVKEINLQRHGSESDFLEWLETWGTKETSGSNYDFVNIKFSFESAKAAWNQDEHYIANLARLFSHLLIAEQRLDLCKPAKPIEIGLSQMTHPAHMLQLRDDLEADISAKFRSVFGVDLILNRNGGNTLPFHVGAKPEIEAGQDRLSHEYLKKIRELPKLNEQGDGMRSFAGVLLASCTGGESILLIDEPEVFLHPPQARILGKLLTEQRYGSRQLFISTHSSDILAGVLESKDVPVTVVRIQREENRQVVSQLSNGDVKKLWQDPLLRYSNLLDGLFHEGVVLCESDSDCLFYKSLMEVTPSAAGWQNWMFTHCGGKSKMHVVISALRSVNVPVKVIADFDVLNSTDTIRRIIESVGSRWDLFSTDYVEMVRGIAPEPNLLLKSDFESCVKEILAQDSSTLVSKETMSKIDLLLKRKSKWGKVKNLGIEGVQRGSAYTAGKRMLESLSNIGVYIVPVGELEDFDKERDRHGQEWVFDVLNKDIANDKCLKEAREFVSLVFPAPLPTP